MEKKIIIFMPSIEGGGVEKNLFLVSNFLKKKINKIAVITISKKYQKKFDNGIEFITLSSNIWDKLSRRFKYFLAILLLIKEILKNRKITVFAFQANIYCIIICKIFFIKIITRSNSAPIGWSQNPLKKLIFKFFLNISDKVMVNSIQFKNELKKEFGVNAACIYNPLNLDQIKKKSKSKSFTIYNNSKKLKILNIGRFTEQKDQITFLKALNIIKHHIKFEAVIIGRGVLKAEFINYIDKNDLNNFVKIYDFVNNPYPLMKQAELFVLTSKYEGLPNVLLEALTLKKFVISSDCSTGPNEILLNGKGGLLFKVGDYKGLSKKLIYYYQNKNKCKKLLNNSIKELKRFDYIKNLNKYLLLVKSLN
ncbi:glycosyltransferase [Candidatus Pelagibacter sp.]|nr:glycosyltransferase [Candidatus Pelagibacter sp.]